MGAADDDIILHNVSHILPFLRIFGHKITKLSVIGDFDIQKTIIITEYIIRYCSKTLIELEAICPDDLLTDKTSETFPNIEKAHFRKLIFVANMQINRIFPVAKDLKMLIVHRLEYNSRLKDQYITHMQNTIRAMPDLHTLNVHLITFP